MEHITLQAPAKINLTLDVHHRRPDGYHELSTIMQTVDLADTVVIKPAPREVHVASNRAEVPGDDRNLAYRAAVLLRTTYQISAGANIYLNKTIPIAAGLAGGSSNAAATLVGLNKLWGLGLTLPRLMELGAMLGADVPFCILQGTALGEGRGERLTPLPAMPECWVVLAKPPVRVATADVYRALTPEHYSVSPATPVMQAALTRGDMAAVAASLGNSLEAVTLKQFPVIGLLKQKMGEWGALGSLMSGSGPTVFGLTASRREAQTLAAKLKGLVEEVYVAQPLTGNGWEILR